MSTTRPTAAKATKLYKTYVLVDEGTYNRRIARAPPSSTNPFQNPHVRETKRLREEVSHVVGDDTKRLESANLELRQLLERYRSEFERATGGRTGKKQRVTAPSTTTVESHGGTVPASPGTPSQLGTPTASSTPTITPSVALGATPRRTKSSNVAINTLLTDTVVPPHPLTPSATFHTETSKPMSPEATAIAGVTPTIVRRVMGGHVTDGDVEKITPLLNGLSKAGALTDGMLVSTINDGGFRAKRADLLTYIRDAAITDPSRRTKTPREVEEFANYLKRKGVSFDVEPSTVRKTARQQRRQHRKLDVI